MVRRLLAMVAFVLVFGCGSRTPLRTPEDGPADDSAQAGAAGGTSGVDGANGDGDTAGWGGGSGDSGAGGHGAENSAGDGSAGWPSGGSGGVGAGGAGVGGMGGAGVGGAGVGGVSGFSAGESGVGGGPIGAGEGGFSGMAGEILNPQGCPTPHPFVLSIDPSGTTGSVRGWLESAAGLVFEDQLPRFVRAFGPDTSVSERGIALWWSIGTVSGDGQGSLYFYAGDFTSSTTEIAVARGARSLTDIDLDALDFERETFDAQTGTILVFRNATSGETVALHMDQILGVEYEATGSCAVVDASWRFLR